MDLSKYRTPKNNFLRNTILAMLIAAPATGLAINHIHKKTIERNTQTFRTFWGEMIRNIQVLPNGRYLINGTQEMPGNYLYVKLNGNNYTLKPVTIKEGDVYSNHLPKNYSINFIKALENLNKDLGIQNLDQIAAGTTALVPCKN